MTDTVINADTNNLSISVIIPTHNRSTLLCNAIESFINQDYPNDKYEIIIVDNASTDGTKQAIEKYLNNTSPVIRYIYNDKLGLHYSRNQGAIEAKNKILYFADDDVIAAKNMLTEICVPFLFDKRVATVTGRVLPKWETPPPKWIERYCNNKFLSLLDPPEDFVISKNINFLYGCHQAVKKDVYIMVGGSNPDTFGPIMLGDGEAGLNTKIQMLGYLFGYNGKAITYHVISLQKMTQKYLNQRMGNDGNFQAYSDYRKYGPSILSIVFILLKTTFIYLPVIYLANIFNLLRYNDYNISRFFVAHTFFYQNNLKYCFRLLRDPKLRKYVRESDWVKNANNHRGEIDRYINGI